MLEMMSGQHGRQSSLLSERSGQSYSDLSFSWTGSSRHSRQSSQLSEGGQSRHSRQRSNLSDRSCQSFDNPAFDSSPRCRRGQQSLYSLHSRQSSAEMSSLEHHLPPHPAFKVAPHYQDQGYQTMVGPQSSPDISPTASLHLSTLSLSLSCPRGVTRPRPPAVPGSVQLDPSNARATFSSRAGCWLGDLAGLSDDLILLIFSHLDTTSLVVAGQVCRQFYLLAWHPSLWTSLTLAGDRLDADAAVKSVLTLLSGRHSSVTTRLHLAGCTRLSDAGLAVIARTCPALTWLDMRACKLVTNTGLAQVVARCSLLHHLDISGCSLVSSLVSGLQPHSRGQLRERLSHGLALRHLDLTDCTRLDDQSLRLILEASSNIEFLYVRRCSNLTGNNTTHNNLPSLLTPGSMLQTWPSRWCPPTASS